MKLAQGLVRHLLGILSLSGPTDRTCLNYMWLSLRKFSMLGGKIWPFIQSLKLHISRPVHCNITKVYSLMTM